MNLLPFETLPAHKPRRFVPEQIDLGDWAQIAPLFDKLAIARVRNAKPPPNWNTGCSTGAN